MSLNSAELITEVGGDVEVSANENTHFEKYGNLPQEGGDSDMSASILLLDAPDEYLAVNDQKITRIKLEGAGEEKEKTSFNQQTCDKFTQEWNTWQKVNGKFDEVWAKTYALVYGT